jgi:cell volume regulation protein A
MDATTQWLLLAGLLLFASVLASVFSARLGFPLLLVFLVAGMLAGEDGPGKVQFDNFGAAYFVGNLALAVILLDGGLRTRLATFRVALAPALALATAGVALTAAMVAAAAVALVDVPWPTALLLGAIIGSTDAAAVFSLLRNGGVALNARVGATLEIESGINDPMAIFLTITLIEWIRLDGDMSGLDIATTLVAQFGIGAAGGLVAGWALREILRRTVLAEGLYALLILGGGLLAFALVAATGGSGFLAIYLIGLVVGNRRTHATEPVLRVMDGLAWLSQAGLFLLLGLLVTPSAVLARAGPALAVAAVLMFVARPLAVAALLAPFRFPPREIAYIAWVGLRGAVPIVLAIFPVLHGVPDAKLLFELAFMVVVTSLLLQGMTLRPFARWLRLELPPLYAPEDRHELVSTGPETVELLQYRVDARSRALGTAVAELRLPAAARVVAHWRGGVLQAPSAVLAAGDIVAIVAPAGDEPPVSEMLAPLADERRLTAAGFFGEFVLEGDAWADDVIATYGLPPLPAAERGATLASLIARRLHGRAVVGDAVPIGRLTLTVRRVEAGRVVEVGLKLPRG